MRVYPVLKAWRLGDVEVKDYSVATPVEVPEGDVITNVVWTADPDDLTVVDNPDPLGTGASIGAIVSTPRPATWYNLTALVTTSSTKKFQVPLGIAGVDKTK